MVNKFQQASYVAYTATPFANVFINPDGQDLFPKNFVYSLNAPTNYIGASSIFLMGAHMKSSWWTLKMRPPSFRRSIKKTWKSTSYQSLWRTP